jgi:hypothetical protein
MKIKHLKVVPNSENQKVGGASCTYRPIGLGERGSCPSTCGIYKECYGRGGFVRYTEQRTRTSQDDLEDIATACKSHVRHNVTGDVFMNDKLDIEYVSEIIAFHKRHPEITGWLYCHRIKDWDDAGLSSSSMPANLFVLSSCDKDDDVRYSREHNWRYARTSTLQNARKEDNEVYCPFDLAKENGALIKDIKLSCASCKICFEGKVNVVFMLQTGTKYLERWKNGSLKVAA